MLAIIGGSGLAGLAGLEILAKQAVETPFGKPSSDLTIGLWQEKKVIFLPRHGEKHTIAPHKINYRANMWALREQGVTEIIAVAAVGGIRSDLGPGTLAVPDQIIDYTYGREQSIYSDNFSPDKHLDFTNPYDENMRQRLITAAQQAKLSIIDGGVYGATQGPRLETSAEIKRMKQDGCTMVGMTGMPEVYLARELDMEYATCGVVANWAAGLGKGDIEMDDITFILEAAMVNVNLLLTEYLVA